MHDIFCDIEYPPYTDVDRARDNWLNSRCEKHKRYMGKMKPRVDCRDCRRMHRLYKKFKAHES